MNMMTYFLSSRFTLTVKKGHYHFVNTAPQIESSQMQANQKREGMEERRKKGRG